MARLGGHADQLRKDQNPMYSNFHQIFPVIHQVTCEFYTKNASIVYLSTKLLVFCAE